jgi:hypothetical protein
LFSEEARRPFIAWAHNRSCTRLYAISKQSIKGNKSEESMFLDLYDFTANKFTQLSSSRISEISQLNQKPMRSFLLSSYIDDSGTSSKSQGKDDNNIQIQVSDFEDRLLILNRKEQKLHYLFLGQIHDKKEEVEEEIISIITKKQG